MNKNYWESWIPIIHDKNKDTLRKIKKNMGGDDGVAFSVYLFENPSSPLSLSCSTSLFDHDCLHIMLRRGLLSQDEAFVVGFSMGTDTKTKLWDVIFFKFLCRYVYPSYYRFTDQELKIFDLGFEYAQKLKSKGFFNLHQFNFQDNLDLTIKELELMMGITEYELDQYRIQEKLMMPDTLVSNRLNKFGI